MWRTPGLVRCGSGRQACLVVLSTCAVATGCRTWRRDFEVTRLEGLAALAPVGSSRGWHGHAEQSVPIGSGHGLVADVGQGRQAGEPEKRGGNLGEAHDGPRTVQVVEGGHHERADEVGDGHEREQRVLRIH